METAFPQLEEVKRRRKSLGLTQEELARLAGVSRSLIAKLETGRLNPSYATARRIFEALAKLSRERRLEGLFGGFTVGDLHHAPVEYVDSREAVHAVWAKMYATAYSQFPVRLDSRIVGGVTERAINRMVMERGPVEVGVLPVGEIMGEPFPMVGVDTPAAAVIPLLQHSQAVLTVERGEVVGIVTNSDIGTIFKLLKE